MLSFIKTNTLVGWVLRSWAYVKRKKNQAMITKEDRCLVQGSQAYPIKRALQNEIQVRALSK